MNLHRLLLQMQFFKKMEIKIILRHLQDKIAEQWS